jgi:hypothetical protein
MIGETGLSRNAILRLYLEVTITLAEEVDRYRHNRWRGRRDCFLYRRIMVDGAAWHRFDFVVKDQPVPTEMEVIWFNHWVRPRTV